MSARNGLRNGISCSVILCNCDWGKHPFANAKHCKHKAIIGTRFFTLLMIGWTNTCRSTEIFLGQLRWIISNVFVLVVTYAQLRKVCKSMICM